MKTLLLILILLTAGLTRAGENPPLLFPAPQFELTDQYGQKVTDQDLRGKAWVVDFIFTRCGGPCPMMTQKMVALTKRINADNVRFVSVSVDPEFDTPSVLRQYAAERGATDRRFIFLTGAKNSIYDLIEKGFKLFAQGATERGPIMHDERFLLIDAGGNVRGVYHSNDEASLSKLEADATSLALADSSKTRLMARFPAINASLNATAGILLCLAYMLIQARRVRLHAITMILAVCASGAFLVCYVAYHYLKWQAGSTTTRFPANSFKPLYLTILLSHTILAVVVLPMVIVTLVRAARRQWERHRKIAAPTFWIWLYVSATGVIVYWMLYHLAPRMAAQL
jgi:protein SCO1/2